MADEVRRQRHGAATTFVRVATVPADAGSPLPPFGAAAEIRIVGAPASRAAAVDRVREVLSAANGVPVSAFSLVDLEDVASADGGTLASLLADLCGVGLELIAEAPIDRLAYARQAMEQVNTAGLVLARLTVDRAPVDMLSLLKRVADLQRAAGGIRAFAPLARHFNPSAPSTGFDDVKRVALARIVVDNVPSIQVDWALYGPKLAQVALTVGADDVDAVSPDDDMSQGHRRSPVEEVRRNIRAAGLDPVERDGRFDRVAR